MAGTETNECKDLEIRKDVEEEEDEEEQTVSAPDGGWGWVIVAAAFVTSLIVDGIIFSFGILLPELLNEFSEGKSTISWIGSGLAGTYLLVGPFVANLANHFDCRRVAILGSLVSSAAFIAAVFARNVKYLIVFYGIVGGIGFGLIYLPSIVMVQYYFEKKRAFATGIAVCGSGIGTFIFSPLTQMLIDTYGWRGMLLIQAGIILHCGAASGLFRPLQPKKKRRQKNSDAANNCDENLQPGTTNKGGLKQMLSGLCHRPKPLLHRINDARQMQWQSQTSFESIPLNDDQHQVVDGNKNEGVAIDANHRKIANGGTVHASELTDNNNCGGPTMQEQQQLGVVHHVPNDEVVDNSCAANGDVCVNEVTQVTRMANGTVVTVESNDISKKVVSRSPVQRTTSPGNKPFGSLRSRRSKDKCRSPLPKPRAEDLARPFYRQDIFFSGSIDRIPEFSKASPAEKLNPNIIEEEVDNGSPKGCCDSRVAQIFKEMVDFSLLKSPTFSLMCVAGFMTFMGFFVPFVYLSDFAKSVGVDKDKAAFLLSVIGIANTVGRVLCGWVSDFPQVKAIHLNNCSLILAGGTTIALPFMKDYAVQVVYCTIFGLAIACFVSLRSIVLVELLGLEKLTNSFGLTLLFQGSASLVGSPIAGMLFDKTGTYDASFYVAGVLIALSGIICVPLPQIAKWEKNRAEKKISREIADEESTLQSTSSV